MKMVIRIRNDISEKIKTYALLFRARKLFYVELIIGVLFYGSILVCAVMLVLDNLVVSVLASVHSLVFAVGVGLLDVEINEILSKIKTDTRDVRERYENIIIVSVILLFFSFIIGVKACLIMFMILSVLTVSLALVHSNNVIKEIKELL